MSKIIEVKVKPNSKQSKVETNEEGTLIAFVKAQPIDGKANAELISLIASHFGLHKRQVSIKTGAAARMKRIELDID
ncbi:MAG: DUF167 domain-containing protein [Planctomycetota bacterium]|nr:DUF167 domain-containing protein [Planctomycetota bacterium]